ncbi:hypothetical protein Tco_0209410 [Tanacetum coccineum]
MASAITCLATNKKFNFSKYIFNNMVKNLEGGVKSLMYPRFVQLFLDTQVEGMSKPKEIYVTPSHTKKVFANMKRQGKDLLVGTHPYFQPCWFKLRKKWVKVQQTLLIPITPTIIQPSTSQPKKKHPRKSKKKNTEVPRPSDSTDDVADENEPTHSNDPLLSGEDGLKIASLKKRVKKLERRNKSRTPGLKRLRNVGRTIRIESSEDAGLGDQEDASKQGRKITDIDADAEVTLIDETQGRNDDDLMFDTGVLDEQEVEIEKVVSTAEVTTAGATTTTVDELTLAHALIEIKAVKLNVRGVMIQEPSDFITTTTTTVKNTSNLNINQEQ